MKIYNIHLQVTHDSENRALSLYIYEIDIIWIFKKNLQKLFLLLPLIF